MTHQTRTRTFHFPPFTPHVQLAHLLAAFVLVGLLYNVAIPLFEAPDEVWHFAFADHLARGQGLPYFAGDQKPVFMREAGQPPLYYAITALAIAPFDRSDFPDFVRFNADHPAITPGVSGDRPNVFIHTRREEWPYYGAVLAAHVARLVSLIFGLFTVLGVYAIVRQVAPAQPSLAVITAAVAAFTPQFVLLCNAVNNDSLMAATATWTVWAGMRILDSGAAREYARFQIPNSSWREWLKGPALLGVMLGLGLLSKLSAIILIPFVGLVLLVAWLRNPLRLTFNILRSAFYVLLFAFVVAGWWYIRNIALYGDPLAWNIWLSDIGVRTPTPLLWQLAPEVPALFRTYWIEFTCGQSVAWLWAILAVAVLVALAGWVINFKFKISDSKFNRSTLHALLSNHSQACGFLLFAWLGLNVAGVVRYMQTTPASQGRLLFPAIAAISLLLVMGLATWRAQWPAYALAGGLLVLTLIAPFAFVQPAFARPVVSSLPVDIIPTQTRFGDALELIGYRLPAHVSPGEATTISTYWRVQAPLTRDQRLLIRLLRADGQSGGQAHFTLGTSLYPTTLWLPGEIVVDEHSVLADSSLQVGTTLHLQVGVGDETTPLLPVAGSAAWFTGDVADLGEIKVVAR